MSLTLTLTLRSTRNFEAYQRPVGPDHYSLLLALVDYWSKTEMKWMSFQWESSRDLNALIDGADTTLDGRLFQLFTARTLRKFRLASDLALGLWSLR